MEYPADSTKLKERPDARLLPSREAGGSFFSYRLPTAIRRTARSLEKFFGRFVAIIVTSVKEFLKDECLNLAAQISYYALFSIFL